jgi:hypothetical protein
MTILGSIVLAAAIAAPADGQQSSPRGNASRPERISPSPEPDLQPPHPIAPTGDCSRVVVWAPQTERRPRGTFSAFKTRDLSFKTRLNDVEEGAHLVTFSVFTPKGHLYQEIRVMAQAESTSGEATVSGRFPVGGTTIATNGLFGRWTVVPHFDGSPLPCAGASAFTITE